MPCMVLFVLSPNTQLHHHLISLADREVGMENYLVKNQNLSYTAGFTHFEELPHV